MRVRARLELALIGLVALAVRVAVVLGTGAYVPATDAGDFDRNALSLALTGHFPVASVLTLQGGPTAFRPPAFSLLLSVAYRIAGPFDAPARWEAGRLMEAGLGAVTVLLIWALARRSFGNRVATVAGAIAAVYPPLILVGSSLLSESLFIPLELAAVLAALEARHRLIGGGSGGENASATAVALGLCLLAGGLTAAAALARSNGIVLLVALAAMVWLPRVRPRRTRLLAPTVLVIACALALVPWTLRNAHVFHSFVPTTTETGYALAGVYNPQVQSGRGPYPGFWYPPVAAMLAIQRADPTINEAQLSSRLTRESLDYISAHPFSVVRESCWSLPRLLGLGGRGFERWIAGLEAYPPTLAIISIYSFWLVGLIALAGIVVLVRGRTPDPGTGGPGLGFWLCPVLLLLSTLPVIGDARYRSPCDPFVLLLCAVALVRFLPRSAPLGSPSG
jgi:4-amino-4-deoxy-L-arabinose transferase-like glycosyltransferase